MMGPFELKRDHAWPDRRFSGLKPYFLCESSATSLMAASTMITTLADSPIAVGNQIHGYAANVPPNLNILDSSTETNVTLAALQAGQADLHQGTQGLCQELHQGVQALWNEQEQLRQGFEVLQDEVQSVGRTVATMDKMFILRMKNLSLSLGHHLAGHKVLKPTFLLASQQLLLAYSRCQSRCVITFLQHWACPLSLPVPQLRNAVNG
jgi:uncharacterized protein YukE